jgi:predicted phosphodiesterase
LPREKAGGAVQVVAFAATHAPTILARDGVLFVNPASATLPADRGPQGGATLARLSLRGPTVETVLVRL